MANYKCPAGKVHWLDDCCFEHLLPVGSIAISDAEADSLIAPSPADLWAGYQSHALAALQDGDLVAMRCIKAGITYPDDWQRRDEELRAILRAPSGDASKPLPMAPAKPQGI